MTGRGAAVSSGETIGVLTREFRARLLNLSPSGCLVETNSRLEVGTIGSLRFVIGESEFADDVQVVRCQPVEGAGSMYRVGARFLWTALAGKGTLRRALQQGSSEQRSPSPIAAAVSGV